MNRGMVWIALALLVAPVAAHGETGYFQQFVHYTIRVKLDPANHTLSGSETIAYTNNSPDTLQDFYLHLYPNAYRNKNTAFMRDYRRRFNFNLFDTPEANRGWLDLSNVTVDGTSVSPDIEDTIAHIVLPLPLTPGKTITVTMNFEEKVRKHLGRAGYSGTHYDLAQWYPKVVVYDEKGFHPDLFRAGEFYGEFGTFDVHAEVPENYVLAATGVMKEGDPGWSLNAKPHDARDSKAENTRFKTVHFHAENVHDFAWCADPTFAVQDTTWNNIKIRSFFRKGDDAWRDSTLVHGVRAVQWLSERVGLYPYPQVSVVEGLLSGGMEYPMLVMDGRASESLVVHEIGHIYFYGLFGNDERAEAWLDEGFTSFQTTWYLTERYGEYGITKDWNWYQRLTPQFTRQGDTRRQLFPLLRLGYGERIATRAEEFKNSYRLHVYQKAALMYFALRYVVGDETFDRILKEYFSEWKFKHVNERRFQDVCESVSGMDLDWFFGEWLHTRKICDYRLAEVDTKPSESGAGYTTRVKIQRKGEIIMPLDLRLTFADGTVQTTRIDGRNRAIDRSFEFPEKPKSASLNAANEIMDINMSDNFLPRRHDWQIDWPNNGYYPEDAYQIRYRPTIWYNDVDRAKYGLHLRGSYANWARRIDLGLYYGQETQRLDFSTSFKHPLRLFGNNASFTSSMYKMEGRRDFTLAIDYRKRRELIQPPSQDFTFALNYHELTRAEYVENPETYQGGAELAPYFRFRVDPQFDAFESQLDFGLRLGREWFGGEYKYSAFTAEGTLHTRAEFVPVDGGLRLFLGTVGGSVPLQQKMFIADGGPLAAERMFFLRSPGAVWDELHYHVGGGGNLRGYREGSFGVNKLLAANLQIGKGLPWISSASTKRLGELKAMAFSDVGWTLDNRNPIASSPRVQALVDDNDILNQTLFDAGLGIRWHRSLPFYDLYVRFDVPFYVNHPEINGETVETKYRYVLSLDGAF